MATERMGDGGPAFPRDHAHDGHNGMTLRDYFAAKAMPFVAGRADLDHTGPHEWAAACYQIADAMLAARSQP